MVQSEKTSDRERRWPGGLGNGIYEVSTVGCGKDLPAEVSKIKALDLSPSQR